MKKVFGILVLIALFVCCSFSVSAAGEEVRLYNYYADNMLFKQNEEAILEGKAPSGTLVDCSLFNSQNELVAYDEGAAGSDGVFELSFMAPKGSFEEYRIVLTADGKVFSELKGVVFGDLWLAGGQSNMELALLFDETGAQMNAENKRGSDALRFLDILHPGYYHGAQHLVPPVPQKDYEIPTIWYKGSDPMIYHLSGVAYHFAESLIEELQMPVGILNANLGGSSIYSWLSREAIESDPQLLADCKSENRYHSASSWDESKVNHVIDMAANYNKTIAPLQNFRLSGMIWYQGEADISWEYGKYARAFNAMQNSYSKLFSFDGDLPIVFTQLASYSYGDLDALQNFNTELSYIQQQKPESRALTSILDVPLTYLPNLHAIHPICKKEVGEKMAYAAKGLVYGLHESYTAATVEKVEISGSSVFITFRDTGDGLLADGDTIRGFSVCGSNGVYFSAKAEFVSDNTVRVYSASVENPCSVAYAYSQTNNNANLFASEKGEKRLAVSPFITDLSYSSHHWHNDSWATCDYDVFWHCHTNEFSGYYNTWNVNGAALSFAKSSIDSGKELRITGTNKEFTISPGFTFNENGNISYFHDIDLDWSDYGTLTFKIKVNSGAAVKFEGLKIQINDKVWAMPAVEDTYDTGCTIEADGKVHTVTLDMTRLYPYGNTYATEISKDDLGKIKSAEFSFSNTGDGSADVSIDDFSFRAESPSQSGLSKQGFNLVEKIKALFVSMYVKIVLLFDRLF